MGAAPLGPNTNNLITVANPAAGAQWIYTVPPKTVLRLITVHWTLDLDSNAADRFITYKIDDGAVPYYYANVAGKFTADLSGTVTFGVSHLYANVGVTFVANSAHADRLFIPAGHRISSLLIGIQAGDQLSGIRILTERFVA